MTTLAGIDLGTTFSCLAILNDTGRPEIVPNADGERITPSVVYFPEDGSDTLVGVEAVNSRQLAPHRVVTKIKRHMGDDEHAVDIDGESWTPPQISAQILEKLRDECSGPGREIARAVITVPAFYDEKRRQAVMQSGQLAGLDVLGIINEPTAAALFYAVTHDVAGKVLVFDLGGGTFDVTIMDVRGKDVDIVCSQGDHELGGVDFDRAIMDEMNAKYQGEHATPLWSDAADASRFEGDAEDAKRTLSRRDKVRKLLHGPQGSFTFELTRDQFEDAIASHVGRTEMLVEMALDEAELRAADIDVVLLVGGSTRVPMIGDRLQKMFGFAPTTAVNVDECVALGAAIHAGMLAGAEEPGALTDGMRAGLRDIAMRDVCNHSYGTIHLDRFASTGRPEEKNHIIIPKNTKLPVSRSEEFFTASDGQTEVAIRITQGEGSDPAFVNILAEPELTLPPGRPAGRKLVFTYSYDTNQRMHCTFEDVESGRKIDVEIGIDADKQEEAAGWSGDDEFGGFIVE